MFALAPRELVSLLALPLLLPLLAFTGANTDNQAPVAVDDVYTIHGCATPLLPGVTANDSDPDNDPFSVTSFPQPPAHGSVSRVGNSVSFCPAYGYTGADNFTYRICDNLGACADATVSLNVVNQPPSSGLDLYDVHGSTVVGPLLINDSDPDGDPVTIGDANHPGIVALPQHGSLSPANQPDRKLYTPNYGYTGSDQFIYNLCDSLGLCAEITVNLNVINQPPVGVADSYDVHGSTIIGPFLINDSDPDGDGVTIGDASHEGIATFPQHGSLSGIVQPDKKLYTPNAGYFGPDGFTYNACDAYGGCTETFVSLNVVNNAPIAGPDSYTVRGTTTIGPLRINDSDPDGDPLSDPAVIFPASHGTVSALSDPDLKSYTPNPGYVGPDNFTYQVCDNFGSCANATVSLTVLSIDDAENLGVGSCNKTVGEPVNVTNGNMYLQQSDYLLPGIGPAINITRTYNSMSQSMGLFGKGWSSAYDESIKVLSATYVRWFRADGQATNFMRASASDPFSPVEEDFHGTLVKNADNSFTLAFVNGGAHRFNAAGKLISLADRMGNQTMLAYNSSSRLTSVTDPFARVLTVTPDTNGRIISIRDSLGTVASYSYGSSGELLSVTYPDNSAFHFAYTLANGNLLLASVTDALGNLVEAHTYDTQGRAITSEKQGGVERYSLSFVGSDETDVTDSLGHVTRYFFDASKGRNTMTRVEGICSCGGSQTQSWTYDNQLNMTSHTNALGQTASYSYDASGNQLSATGVLGTSTFTYNQFGEVLTATDALGGVTTNTYDSFGNLLSVKDALNNVTTFTYDGRGQLLTMTNAMGKSTTLTWDTAGRLTQTKDALNNLTSFVYDARARLTKATDALNRATTFAYDAANRVIKVTRADGSAISCTYDLAGRRTKIIDPLKNATSFAYDGAYRLTGETDALGKSVSYTYDLMSNLTRATDQLGRTTDVDYDDFNRPTTITYPAAVAGASRLQEKIEFDAAGNVTRRIDTAGRVRTFEYDNANRLIKSTDPLLQVTRYEFDARSNVTAVIDALGQRYEFGYDALSRLTSAMRGGLQMSLAYDAVGNLLQRTDYNGASTAYTYDGLNRLTKITYPDAMTTTYAYDKLSRLTAATNITGTVTFVYDQMGRVTSTTDVWGQALGYSYDANGRRTALSFGSSKKAAFTYTYDAINRLTQIAESQKVGTSYAYDDASRLSSRALPNGVVTSYTYDGLDRLTRLKDAKGATVIADNNYSYNNAGQIIQNLDQSGLHTYVYDDLDRLISASYPATGNETYAYDPVGNRASSHRSASYGYQPFNRLTSADAASYVYDSNSNLISRSLAAGTTQFQWDFENRLTQVVTPSAGSVSYKYDALGRQVQSAPTAGVSTNFTYDGDDVAQDKTSTGVVTEYLNGPGIDNKIRQKTGNTLYYFAQDHLGSTTALTDSNGAVVERETYDAFGNSAASARTRYGFTGRERDSVTGLIYYRARWYDPQLGRFISEDPIGLAGGINQFSYVGNNPQNRKDPTGLYEIDVHYYLTYFLAKKTGCFTDAEARLIADADQATDENESTKPGAGWTAEQQMQNRKYHDLQPGNYEGQVSPELWQQATSGPTNYVGLGRYLHFLQDSFSHAGFTNDAWGHSPVSVLYGDKGGTHTADKTNYDVPKALRMAGATWIALNNYAKEKKCGCQGRIDPAWWKQVIDFARLPGGDDYTSMEHSIEDNLPIYLKLKREILDVPWR